MAEIETHEAADPVLFLWRKLVPNSGGPGLIRGGQALEQAYAIQYSDAMAGPAFNTVRAGAAARVRRRLPRLGRDLASDRATNIADLLADGRFPTKERLDGRSREVAREAGAAGDRSRRRIRRR